MLQSLILLCFSVNNHWAYGFIFVRKRRSITHPTPLLKREGTKKAGFCNPALFQYQIHFFNSSPKNYPNSGQYPLLASIKSSRIDLATLALGTVLDKVIACQSFSYDFSTQASTTSFSTDTCCSIIPF